MLCGKLDTLAVTVTQVSLPLQPLGFLFVCSLSFSKNDDIISGGSFSIRLLRMLIDFSKR